LVAENGHRALGDEDGGAVEAAGAEIVEGAVGFVEGIGGGVGDDADLGGEAEEIEAVLAGEIGDGEDVAFTPKEAVGEGGDIGHVNAGADDAAAFADGLERDGNEGASGGENNGGVEGLGGHGVGAAGPFCAEAEGEGLGLGIAGAGEGENGATLPFRDLGDDVGGGAEAVEAEARSGAGSDEGSPADETGAEERGNIDIAAGLAEGEGEAGIGDRGGGEAAVARVAGEEGVVAEVFLVARAIGADAAGPREPWNADALADAEGIDAGAEFIDAADDFVAGNDGEFWVGEIAIDDMQVGAAYAAGGDFYADFAGAGAWVGEIGPLQGEAGFVEDHCIHRAPLVFTVG